MAWRLPFLLGRPAAKAQFEINPDGVDWEDQKLGDATRGGDGTLNAVTVSRNRPVLRFSGAYITPDFWNQLRSLMMIDHTPLVLEPCDLIGKQIMEVWTERCIPSSLTTIPLADNSLLRGSALEVAAGGPSCINLIGAWPAPGAAGGRLGTGTNYLIGGTVYYGQNFEPPLVLGELGGQDSWVILSANGSPNCHCVVNGSGPLDGTQDLQYNALGTSNLPIQLYRRILSGGAIPGAYIMDYLNQQDGGQVVAYRLGMMNNLDAVSWELHYQPGGQARLIDLAGTSALFPVTSVMVKVTVSAAGVINVFFGGVLAKVGQAIYTAVDRVHTSIQGVSTVILRQGNVDDLLIHSAAAATYDDAARSIILPNPLPNMNPVYVSYASTCMAVHLQRVPSKTQGGHVDAWQYDLELEGA